MLHLLAVVFLGLIVLSMLPDWVGQAIGFLFAAGVMLTVFAGIALAVMAL